VVELLGADVSVGEVAVDVKLGGPGKRGIVTGESPILSPPGFRARLLLFGFS
jgi:hypothetical protein